MPKRRSSPVHLASNTRVVATISRREIEKKIRKPLPPPTKTHASKKVYRRKAKHPNREE